MANVEFTTNDVYAEVRDIREKLSAFILDQSTRLALLEQRTAELEKDIAAAAGRRWQIYLALIGVIGALLAALIPLFT
ncbi:hypothetical protein [Sciscionella sediminilitoris]|uniref:hypothetical protein n=1 Tax=Sciscionella sediminilitoris TaxID=1445613 RepID=UPI0004DF1EE1|nr:hypothetical protein [Sciscionella sp. SE31]